jgi:hypothetical protein
MLTSQPVALKFTVTSTDYSVPLGMRVSLDGVVFYENAHVSSETSVQHQLSDDDGEHELVFQLFGKRPEHTKITDTGEIVSDAMLEINNITLDEINIDQIFQSLAIYRHDFNGTQAPADDKFYGSIGCNGIVTLKFTTPVYLWLLENM